MKTRLFIALVVLMTGLTASAQRNCGLWLNTVPLVADTVANNLFATIEPRENHALKATLRWDESRITNVALNGVAISNGQQGNLDIADWTMNAANTLTVVSSDSRQWNLIISTLPFLTIDCPLDEMSSNYSMSKGDENHTKKYPGYLSVIDARCRTKLKDSEVEGMARFNSDINIRLRGATSGNKPKKNFNIELTKDGEPQDVHLLGYRKDDDWILGSEYIDFSRMRNRVLMDLWNSIDDLPYAKDNDYQCNGTQGEFVEVFINGAYYGLMCFTDKIDRKKLNLKKTKEADGTSAEVTRGLLWKANWECGETYLGSYDERPANDSFLWPYIESKNTYGWEQKYPDDNVSQAFFDPICDLIDFLDSPGFKTGYNDWLYEQNVIDFILFIQVFQLIDNQKKNYYLSMRNVEKEHKYLFTLWDLDGSIGRLAGGSVASKDSKQMAWGEKLGYHHLIHVFKNKKLRPDGFATKMNNRWQYLKTHELSLTTIRALMEKYGNLFTTSGAWEREKIRWSPTYKQDNIKITDTPQEEIDFMIRFLEENYAIFDQKMASDNWTHDDYDEEDYVKGMTPDALYVIGNDVVSKHEDNTVTLSGTVNQEPVEGISEITYKDGKMTIARDDVQQEYAIDDIKEVRTQHVNIYPTPAFVPLQWKDYLAFDSRYAPIDEAVINPVPTTFNVQRTVTVNFDGTKATVKGNLDGITATVDGTSVCFSTALEGVELVVGGRSDAGRINIESQHPWKLAAAKGGTLLSSITANCDLTVHSAYALNFYNEEFDGKCIMTSGDITIEEGILYFLMTSSGTLTDASFGSEPTKGARAVMAENIYVNGGNIYIKTIGHHGAVGLAAAKKLFINGGNRYIATYDDPLKSGSAIDITGGFTFTSSLTNDGCDSKGDIHMKGGSIYSCGPEGAEAAFDVNHFYCDGGTVIGVAFKSDQPIANKSAQAFFRLNKSSGVKRYVKIMNAGGSELAVIETPAYSAMTLLYSSPALEKGENYTLLTGDTLDSLQELTTITAE